MQSSDQDLAERAMSGGREAFDALVDRHGPGVLAYLRRMTGDKDEAQDLFQETFLRAFRSLDSLRDPGRFRPWLIRIATNFVHKAFHRRQRTPVPSADLELEIAPDQGARLELEERRSRLRHAVESLPPRQREVLSLRLDLDLPYAEIADNLGITEENARANHYQALRTLRQRMNAPPSSPTARDVAPGDPT